MRAFKDTGKVALPLAQPFSQAVVHDGTARGFELELQGREERERHEHDEGAEETGEETAVVNLEREDDGTDDDERGEGQWRCHADDGGRGATRYERQWDRHVVTQND